MNEKVTLYQYKNVYLTPSGVCFNFSGLLPHTYYTIPGKIIREQQKIALLNFLLRRRFVLPDSNGLIVHSIWSIGGYFHWLTESLPRLFAVENRREFELILPEKAMNFSFIKESLEEIEGLKIKIVPDKRLYVVKSLTVPSTIENGGIFSKADLTRVSEHYKKRIRINPPFRRIFISRQKARARKIVNFEDVSQLLKQYDFEIHSLEDVPFLQQVQLFSESSICMSIHGAALSNTMFMPPQGKVIELIRDVNGPENVCYIDLAKTLELDYERLYCKAENPEEKFDTGNIEVDISQLKNIIEKNI